MAVAAALRVAGGDGGGVAVALGFALRVAVAEPVAELCVVAVANGERVCEAAALALAAALREAVEVPVGEPERLGDAATEKQRRAKTTVGAIITV